MAFDVCIYPVMTTRGPAARQRQHVVFRKCCWASLQQRTRRKPRLEARRARRHGEPVAAQAVDVAAQAVDVAAQAVAVAAPVAALVAGAAMNYFDFSHEIQNIS